MVICIIGQLNVGYAEPISSGSIHFRQDEPLTLKLTEDHLRRIDFGMPLLSPEVSALSQAGTSQRLPLGSVLPDDSLQPKPDEVLSRHWLGVQLGGQGIFTLLYQYMLWSRLGAEMGVGVGSGFLQSSLGLTMTMWRAQDWSLYFAGGGTWMILGEERVIEHCHDQQCEIRHETLAHFQNIGTTRVGVAYFWGESHQHKCTVEGGLWWSTSLLEDTWLHHQGVTGMMGLGYLHSF